MTNNTDYWSFGVGFQFFYWVPTAFCFKIIVFILNTNFVILLVNRNKHVSFQFKLTTY